MRPPQDALVVDTSVLIAAVGGRNSAAFATVAGSRRLLVTDTAVSDALKRIEFGLKAPERLPALHAIARIMNLIEASSLPIADASLFLRDAVASQNGSIADAHILACAWSFHADIWSFDRDFAGTGVASWSTANLMRALADEAG